jgi:hypothetical protein
MKKVVLFVVVLNLVGGFKFAFGLDVWAIGEGVRICPITGKAFEENSFVLPGGIRGDYQNSNWVWDRATNTVTLYGARNEVVAFQLIIDRGDERLKGVRVEVTDLVKGDTRLERSNIEIFRQWYNYIPRTPPGTFATNILDAGWYPEVLVPAEVNQFGSNFDLPSDHFQTGSRRLGNQQKNQAIWIDIFIPLEQPAGDYTGKVKVIVSSPTLEKEINVKLVVWDFTLPREFHCTIELMDGPFDKHHISLAHRHRVTLTDAVEFRYTGRGADARIFWSRLRRYEGYWSGSAFTKGPGAGVPIRFWRLPFDVDLDRTEGPEGGSTWPWVNVGVWPVTHPYPEDYKTTAKALMRDIAQHFGEHYPQVKLVIWVNGLDEPNFHKSENGERYLQELANRIREYGEMIDEAVGDKILHRLDIGSGFARCAVDLNGDNPDGEPAEAPTMNAGELEYSPAQEVIDCLKDSVDLWTVGCKSMRARLLRQNGITLIQAYNAKEARLGAPSINVEGISWRVTCWILWKFRIDSACEWKFDGKEDGREKNPFQEVYMGLDYSPTPTPGIWHYIFVSRGSMDPVRRGLVMPGIRLKAMRRGLQDYEYFWLVTSCKEGDRSFADELVCSVVRGGLDDGSAGGMADWEHHPQKYFEVRKRIAEEILRSSVEKNKLSFTLPEISYPNPFTRKCWIPINGRCKIYNILGQLVKEIEFSRTQAFSRSRVYWDGKDNGGLKVPAGVYFYEVGGETVRKMLLLR